MRQAYRTALVTGASSGLGASFARLLAARGSALVLVARREDRLAALAAELRDAHDADVTVLPADLASRDGLESVAARLADGPVCKLQLPERINVTALARLARAAVGGMLERGFGGILNVSSMAGFGVSPGSSVYGATKAFVTSLSESLHAELAGTGVHVTALCPGFTRTEFHAANNVEIGYLPSVAWLEADDVARAGLAAVAEGRVLAVPGAQYKVAAGAARVLPGAVLRQLARLIGRL